MPLKGLLFSLLLVFAVDAAAQEVVGPPGESEAAKLAPLESSVPLKLDVVFTRYRGEIEIGRLPFTLLLNSDNTSARLKMGLMVPLRYEKEGMHSNVVFKDVVTSVNCRARPLSGERFALACNFDQDSVYSPDNEDPAEDAKANAALTPPVVRRFYSETTLVLRHGQTLQHSATDPLTGEVLKVDVTLTVVR
jgi:hypothetical protein